MGVAAAGKKDLGQRNPLFIRASRGQADDLTRPGRQDGGIPIDLFQPEGGGAREDELVIETAESIISGILDEGTAVISLRTNVTGCGKAVEGEVLAFGAFERIVTFVTNEGKSGTADVRWQGKQTKLRGRKV